MHSVALVEPTSMVEQCQLMIVLEPLSTLGFAILGFLLKVMGVVHPLSTIRAEATIAGAS
jgi:hypothetical protein